MRFGISGYLYRNAVLYYDKETETFWGQTTGKAVVGPQTGKQLKWIPTTVVSFGEWKKRHPKTTVLAPVQDMRNYRGTHRYYKERYHSHDELMFPMPPSVKIDPKYKKKDNCTVVVWKDRARCYPHPAFEGRIEDGDLIVTKDKNGFVKVADKAGKQVPSMHAYWFAWCAFYPEGQTWSPPS